MGDFQKAEEYILMLINDSQDKDSLSKVRYYSNLVMYYNEQMKFDIAYKTMPPNHSCI
ncbi:hypothetical protein I4U23_004919 [Adineta vaga]|nr:hypothetical protein I4U23_004919 [Adineta vaga]